MSLARVTSRTAQRLDDALGLFGSDEVVKGGDNAQLLQGDQDTEREAVSGRVLYFKELGIPGCLIQIRHVRYLDWSCTHTMADE